MKALPLWQPWASLVACGAKRVETRDYPPHRLGLVHGQRIAIHATKRDKNLWLCEHEDFAMHIPFGFPPASNLPLGAIVATCTLDRSSQIRLGDTPAQGGRKAGPRSRHRGQGRLIRTARVENWPRTAKPAWRLIQAAMEALGE